MGFLPRHPRNKGNKTGSSESQMQVQKHLRCNFNSYWIDGQVSKCTFYLEIFPPLL